MAVPATRSLPAVLRAALDTDPPLRMLVGTYGPPLSAPDNTSYVNVIIDGVTLKVPKPAHLTAVAAGSVAYVLAWPGHMILYGTVPP
jgi:hypothetical protein